MKEKFSGRQAMSAPKLLGLAQHFSGAGKIVRDDVARGHLYGGYFAHLFRCLGSRGGRVCALDSFDNRIIPTAGNSIIPPRQSFQRLFEHLGEQKHGPPTTGPAANAASGSGLLLTLPVTTAVWS
jgi:hypothetical protein